MVNGGILLSEFRFIRSLNLSVNNRRNLTEMKLQVSGCDWEHVEHGADQHQLVQSGGRQSRRQQHEDIQHEEGDACCEIRILEGRFPSSKIEKQLLKY